MTPIPPNTSGFFGDEMNVINEFFQNIIGNIKTVNVGDIFDILITAYIIYKVLMATKRTAAGGIIKGIAIIFVVIWLTNILNLNVINYILTSLLSSGLIIVIVLFQPELRGFLGRFGSKNFKLFSWLNKTESRNTEIQLVADACYSMASHRVGALIVFERDTGLNEFANSGTFLNAEITRELLENIFYPKAPLHDGAVIIRKHHILAARCTLPPSGNQGISPELGMRHRAGIGITEQSDAVTVIVSEETGSVSLAVDGLVKRNLTRDIFIKMLEEYIEEEDDKKGLNKMFVRVSSVFGSGGNAK